MSYITTSQYNRLSDSLEHRLMRDALSRSEPVSRTHSIKRIYTGIKAGVLSIARFIADVSNAMDKARASNVRFTGSHW